MSSRVLSTEDQPSVCPSGRMPLTQQIALHLVFGTWEERQWAGAEPGEAACRVTDILGFSRDHASSASSSSASASEETCEALLLKNKGGIEVTRATSFGTLREGGSRSLVVCIE